MASSAENKFPGFAIGQANAIQFERGLTFEDAERLAATFKPSWELDDAPFAAGAMDAADVASLGNGGVNEDVRSALEGRRSQSSPPHAPAPRVESHEPDASVILDRGITAEQLDAVSASAPAGARVEAPDAALIAGVGAVPAAYAPPPPSPVAPDAPFAVAAAASPVFAAPAAASFAAAASSSPFAPPVPAAARAPVSAAPASRARSAPPAAKVEPPRYSADDSIEVPIRKSNKPLFLGIGAAVVLAVAVLGFRAATSSEPTPETSATAAPPHEESRIPAPPAATIASPAALATAVAPTSAPATPQAPAPQAPSAKVGSGATTNGTPSAVSPPPLPRAPSPAPRAVAPPPRPHPAAPRPAAPKTPPKSPGGGIVRDVPF